MSNYKQKECKDFTITKNEISSNWNADCQRWAPCRKWAKLVLANSLSCIKLLVSMFDTQKEPNKIKLGTLIVDLNPL